MKNRKIHDTVEKPRISLEEKIKLWLRKLQTAQQRRLKRENKPPRPKFRCLPVLVVIIGVLAMLSFLSRARAENAGPEFEQANAAFSAGDYRAAIARYDEILAHNGASASVLFNLGNAHYRCGQFGAAILDYERAQVLAPRNHSIEANLRLAREKAGVPAPEPNTIQQLAGGLSPNSLAWIGSVALAIICLALGVSRISPRLAKFKAIGIVAGVPLLAVIAAFAIRWPEFNRAIVVTANAPARIAPADTAAESFALKAGEQVTVAKSYGPFILARTTDGRSGWVSDKDISRIFAAQFTEGNRS